MEKVKNHLSGGGKKRSPMMCRRGKHFGMSEFKTEGSVVEWCPTCGCLRVLETETNKETWHYPDSYK